MNLDPDELELPDAAIGILDAVDDRRLALDAPEVAAWRAASPQFENAIADLLFARESWAATRVRFELARAELPAVADHRCVVDVVTRLRGVRPAASRRLPWAACLAAAALSIVALALNLGHGGGRPPRETLGREIRTEVVELGRGGELVIRWTGPVLVDGESFRVRLRSGGQVRDVARVTAMEWRPGRALENAEEPAFQVQRLDAFRRAVQSSEWVSVTAARRR